LKRAFAINGGDILAQVTGCAVVGLEGAIVEVEVDVSSGLPSFVIIGSHLAGVFMQARREKDVSTGTTG